MGYEVERELGKRLDRAMATARRLRVEYWRLQKDMKEVQRDTERVMMMSFRAGRREPEDEMLVEDT